MLCQLSILQCDIFEGRMGVSVATNKIIERFNRMYSKSQNVQLLPRREFLCLHFLLKIGVGKPIPSRSKLLI